MPREIHGTRQDPKKHHPVFDLAHWEGQFPLGDDRHEGGLVDNPRDLARVEQARRLARGRGTLGPTVPADVFVWADTPLSEKPWLTRIGGLPWRERGKPWPMHADGVPLTFLGQICFADSKDILPFELPGEVALIFGTHRTGWVSIDGGVLEWAARELEDPEEYTVDAPMSWNVQLPFAFHGVMHRTVQYADPKAFEPAFEAVGYEKGGWGISSIQATQIGRYASIPQGWPFGKDDGRSLVATLSSFYFGGEWPLCDIPTSIPLVYADGRSGEARNTGALSFGVGDAGALWIYRDRDGNFKLDEACG